MFDWLCCLEVPFTAAVGLGIPVLFEPRRLPPLIEDMEEWTLLLEPAESNPLDEWWYGCSNSSLELLALLLFVTIKLFRVGIPVPEKRFRLSRLLLLDGLGCRKNPWPPFVGTLPPLSPLNFPRPSLPPPPPPPLLTCFSGCWDSAEDELVLCCRLGNPFPEEEAPLGPEFTSPSFLDDFGDWWWLWWFLDSFELELMAFPIFWRKPLIARRGVEAEESPDGPTTDDWGIMDPLYPPKWSFSLSW